MIGVENSNEIPAHDFDTIIQFVTQRLPTAPVTEKLRPENATHRLLLIADLVDLLRVTKRQELLEALLHFGALMDGSELERSTKLLEFFGHIQIEERGNEPFYVRREKADRTWVDYTAQAGKPKFDRSRFKLDCETSIRMHVRKKSILDRLP